MLSSFSDCYPLPATLKCTEFTKILTGKPTLELVYVILLHLSAKMAVICTIYNKKLWMTTQTRTNNKEKMQVTAQKKVI